MARIRSIKPEFFLDEDVARLPFEFRLAFVGLWCEADREGRLRDQPRRLKATIFPYDDVDFEGTLKALHRRGFITRYRIDGDKLIQINNFDEHQRPHHTERPSTIPSPNGALTVKRPSLNRKEGKGREGKGERKGEGKGGGGAPPKNVDNSVDNSKRKAEIEQGVHDIFDDPSWYRKMRSLFPRVNFDLEKSKLLARLESHWSWWSPKRDIKKTCTNWIQKAEEFAREKPERQTRAAEIRGVDAGEGKTPTPRAHEKSEPGPIAGTVTQVLGSLGGTEND